MDYAIGVDLGGTKIEAALVDEAGNVISKHRVPTGSENGWEQILKNLQEAIDKVKTVNVIGIGIGTPGFIHNNELHSSVPGLDTAIKEFLKIHPTAVVANDANCFALAEHMFGAGKGIKNMVGVIWGTGIGGGIVINNRLVEGAIGGAGEFGHTTLDINIKSYKKGGPNTWEGLCSGPNIVRRYKEAGGTMENPGPGEIFASDEEPAKKVKEETLHFMGVALGNLVNTLNPEIIVLGGGVSNIDVYEELNAEMRKNSIPASRESCKVVRNERGDSSGVLGAAALVFGHE